MAEPAPSKGDPFEAFRKKQIASKEQERNASRDAKSTAAGWQEGLGPVGDAADPKLPKGYIRGRFETAKTVDEEELAKLRPTTFEPTRRAPAPDPTELPKPRAIPDDDQRLPRNFRKF